MAKWTTESDIGGSTRFVQCTVKQGWEHKLFRPVN